MPFQQNTRRTMLAMVAQQQQQSKPKASTKDIKSKPDNKHLEKKIPPFSNTKGKLGHTKQWNGKTYCYCPANHKRSHWHAHNVKACNTKQWNRKTYCYCLANHKHSHWHTHKVKDCNTYKKMQKEKDKKTTNTKPQQVTVDPK